MVLGDVAMDVLTSWSQCSNRSSIYSNKWNGRYTVFVSPIVVVDVVVVVAVNIVAFVGKLHINWLYYQQ